MSQLDLAAVTLPAAPPCPPWCNVHDTPDAEWDLSDPAGTSKTCRHVWPAVTTEMDGDWEIAVERYACVRWPTDGDGAGPAWPGTGLWVEIYPITVEFLGRSCEMTGDQAADMARKLLEAGRFTSTGGCPLGGTCSDEHDMGMHYGDRTVFPPSQQKHPVWEINPLYATPVYDSGHPEREGATGPALQLGTEDFLVGSFTKAEIIQLSAWLLAQAETIGSERPS